MIIDSVSLKVISFLFLDLVALTGLLELVEAEGAVDKARRGGVEGGLALAGGFWGFGTGLGFLLGIGECPLGEVECMLEWMCLFMFSLLLVALVFLYVDFWLLFFLGYHFFLSLIVVFSLFQPLLLFFYLLLIFFFLPFFLPFLLAIFWFSNLFIFFFWLFLFLICFFLFCFNQQIIWTFLYLLRLIPNLLLWLIELLLFRDHLNYWNLLIYLFFNLCLQLFHLFLLMLYIICDFIIYDSDIWHVEQLLAS